jgi:hypothetical protein
MLLVQIVKYSYFNYLIFKLVVFLINFKDLFLTKFEKFLLRGIYGNR